MARAGSTRGRGDLAVSDAPLNEYLDILAIVLLFVHDSYNALAGGGPACVCTLWNLKWKQLALSVPRTLRNATKIVADTNDALYTAAYDRSTSDLYMLKRQPHEAVYGLYRYVYRRFSEARDHPYGTHDLQPVQCSWLNGLIDVSAMAACAGKVVVVGRKRNFGLPNTPMIFIGERGWRPSSHHLPLPYCTVTNISMSLPQWNTRVCICVNMPRTGNSILSLLDANMQCVKDRRHMGGNVAGTLFHENSLYVTFTASKHVLVVDCETNATRRIELGIRVYGQPTVHPRGDRLFVMAYRQVAGKNVKTVIYAVDPLTGRILDEMMMDTTLAYIHIAHTRMLAYGFVSGTPYHYLVRGV